MSFQIADDVILSILRHAVRAKPNASCGVIFLSTDGRLEFVPIRNLQQSVTQWEMDPIPLIREERAREDNNERLIAIVRAYPGQSTAVLSRADVEGATFAGEVTRPGIAQVVVALAGDEPDIRAYVIAEGGDHTELPVEILGEQPDTLMRFVEPEQPPLRATEIRLPSHLVWSLRINLGLIAFATWALLAALIGLPSLLLLWLASNTSGVISVLAYVMLAPLGLLYVLLMLWWFAGPLRTALAPWGGATTILTIVASMLLLPAVAWALSDLAYTSDLWPLGALLRIGAWLWFGTNLLIAWRWFRTGYAD